jgi:hypothetical protein
MPNEFTESTIVKAHCCSDVIFGRGNGVSSWPGNVAFRHFVWKYRQKYMVARRSGRREIGRAVTQEMKSLNGRFLIINPETGNYHEVSEKRAEDKACQSLREKDAKIPTGFDLKAMKNKKKWFRSIINRHKIAQSQDCVSSPMPLVDDKESRDTCHISKRSSPPLKPAENRGGQKLMSLSVPTPNHTTYHKTYGKYFPTDEGPSGYNDIIHGDDLSVMTLDHLVHSTILFPGESIQSVDGFGDDNSVLVDLKQWPDRDDPAF